MYIIAEHEITNPKTFWEKAQSVLASLPSNVKVHQTLPNSEGTKAVCLWEAGTLDQVKAIVEGAVGNVSRNTYFAVQADKAMGLPTNVRAGVTV
jgi:hypothetical protein